MRICTIQLIGCVQANEYGSLSSIEGHADCPRDETTELPNAETGLHLRYDQVPSSAEK